jgi:hypothetical protein
MISRLASSNIIYPQLIIVNDPEIRRAGTVKVGLERAWWSRVGQVTKRDDDASFDYVNGQAIAKGLTKEQTTAGWRLRSVHLRDIG